VLTSHGRENAYRYLANGGLNAAPCVVELKRTFRDAIRHGSVDHCDPIGFFFEIVPEFAGPDCVQQVIATPVARPIADACC